jgi:ATP-binding cassette subfamily B protein
VRSLLRVLPYLRPYKRLAVLLGALLLIASLTGLLSPWPLYLLVNCVLGQIPLPHWMVRLLGPAAQSKVSVIIFVVSVGWGLNLLENAVSVISAYAQTKLEQSIVLDFRSDLFQHVQKLSFSFHDQAKSGMVIYQVNFQGDAAAGLLMAIVPLVQSAITLVGMFYISMRLDFMLAMVALSVVPFLYYSVGYYATHIQSQLRDVKLLEGSSLAVVHESLSMLKVIVAFCREPYMFGLFRNIGERAVSARVKVTVRQTLFSLAVNMITATGTTLVLGIGAWHVLQGKLNLGGLLVLIAYIAAVYKPLEAISYTIGSLQDKFVGLRFAWEILDEEPEIQDLPDALPLKKALGHIKFENVSFTYTGRAETLKNVSLEAFPGQVIAIVGPTGAGKTTLVSLIPRFYMPTSGRILVDGNDIAKLTLRSLREQISLVPQEPMLFGGTIAENIGYGRFEATREDIIQAARDANAHDFISRLPKGYETNVGEGGAQLSGGERQRICVARAFIKNAPILILDEPTSAIDSKTEAVILDALDRLMVGRTTFMIAHRLSTIHQSDMVLVMDDGRIVESGTHQELLAQGTLYKQLHDIQSGQRQRRGRTDPLEPFISKFPQPPSLEIPS